MSNLKAAVGEKEAAIIRKRLNAWAKSCNPTCADCSRTNPTWASVNLGVLVCLECAGRHRSLGTHISKMRSITLDTVLPEEAHFLLQMTNELANRYWEARLAPDTRSQARAQASFVQQKYTDRKWVVQDSSIPAPSRECVPQSHPWWSAQDTSSSAAAAAPPVSQAAPAAATKSSQPSSVVIPAAAAAVVEALDLIDFGDSPKQAAVPAPTAPDPFSATGVAASLSQSAVEPKLNDPFGNNAATAQPAVLTAPSARAPQAPQPPIDPFAALSLSQPAPPIQAPIMAHAASAPAMPASGPSISAGMSCGHHSRTPSDSSAMSAPTGSSTLPVPPPSALPGTQAAAGGSMQPAARRPQSKAELNAHILSLYSRPSSNPGVQPGMAFSQHAGTTLPQQPGAGMVWTNPANAYAVRPQHPHAARLHSSGHAVPGSTTPAHPR